MQNRSAAFGLSLLIACAAACAPDWSASKHGVDAGLSVLDLADASRLGPSSDAAHASPDAGADAAPPPPVPGKASVPTAGMLGTGGSVSGTHVHLTDDGFEALDRSCGKQVCVEGGIFP